MSLTHLTDVIDRMYAQAVEEVLAQHWGHTGLSMGQRYDQPMARTIRCTSCNYYVEVKWHEGRVIKEERRP